MGTSVMLTIKIKLKKRQDFPLDKHHIREQVAGLRVWEGLLKG